MRPRAAAHTTKPDAPAAAQRILADIAATYPLGAAQVDTWVTLTFTPPSRNPGRWTHHSVCTEIAARLPALTAALHGAGATLVTPMTGEELTAIVNAAYDPTTAATVVRRIPP